MKTFHLPNLALALIATAALFAVHGSPAIEKKKKTTPATVLDGYRFEFPVVGKMPEKPKEGADGVSALVKGDPKTTDNFKAVQTFGGEKGKRYAVTLRFRGVLEPMMKK